MPSRTGTGLPFWLKPSTSRASAGPALYQAKDGNCGKVPCQTGTGGKARQNPEIPANPAKSKAKSLLAPSKAAAIVRPLSPEFSSLFRGFP